LQARYPIQFGRANTLPLYADHHELLEEDEAFIGLQYLQNSKFRRYIESEVTTILVARHPSYFAGDLQKLKLVSVEEMLERGGKEKYQFYKYLYAGLVLSTKGQRSTADKCSGGDYDGDTAWVCYDQELTEQISSTYLPANTLDLKARVSRIENTLACEASDEIRMNFARHFSGHQRNLGTLSNYLDEVNDFYGVDSNDAIAIGNQAFLQVRYFVLTFHLSDTCGLVIYNCFFVV
jgi:hypothetical protein